MDYKIKYLACKNFKFFYGSDEDEESNKLVLDGKNLLLYGENGSGKSSIYWALYTILQSSIKSEKSDVKKYFNIENPENLRNKFADSNEQAGISICFVDSDGRTLGREISDTSVNTVNDPFTLKTLLSSDFINYKYLSQMYDFRNSQLADLFPLFERDLFPFIDLEEVYCDENNMLLEGKTLASDWWNNILETPKRLPYNTNIVRVSSSQYKEFKNRILPRFCDLLKQYLNSITEKANNYLENEFFSPFRLKFDFRELKPEYNKPIPERAKAKDGKFYRPKILLELTYVHTLLNDTKNKINKPHTFLNEAKLTAIALSIRLAMLDSKLNAPESGKILVLDDLLISLDMSNRDIVLDIILKKSKDYQLLIFTHDRAFYNIVKSRTENKDKDKDKWIYKEMYHKLPCETDVPIPVILNTKSHLSCALKYLKEFDYPACANYLRKESERVLCYLLPESLTIELRNSGESKPLPLEKLISNFKQLCQNLVIDESFCEKLTKHKNFLLNPLSHDNIKSPIYKQELISCIEILERLNKFKKTTITNEEKSEPLFLSIEGWRYHIQPQKMFFAIIDHLGIPHYNNPTSLFVSKQHGEEPAEIYNHTHKLNQGLQKIIRDLKPPHDDLTIIRSNLENNQGLSVKAILAHNSRRKTS